MLNSQIADKGFAEIEGNSLHPTSLEENSAKRMPDIIPVERWEEVVASVEKLGKR